METVMLVIYAAASLLGPALAVAAYSGLFHSVVVQTRAYPLPRLTLLYKFIRGPFEDLQPVFEELSRLAPGEKWMGLYYDNPYQVKPEDIRSALGCIVSEGDAPPNLSLKRLLEAKGYREIQLPTAEKAIHTTFPWRNRLSFFIAMKRVWDALINYQIKHSLAAHPWMEVFGDGMIRFVGVLDHHADFYVPETGGAVTRRQD
ncbi:hypothetical protein NP493_922g01006 [Ridgeia piscesae]|uniref:Uncharacterized protein n=1 Tax=Ridgeia piscesae TaxID=27915 RepID=A0AAD9KKN9_RIDPI|nr:hypothetical protein NP493_922g01006 [Ridgeia piscesae]